MLLLHDKHEEPSVDMEMIVPKTAFSLQSRQKMFSVRLVLCVTLGFRVYKRLTIGNLPS